MTGEPQVSVLLPVHNGESYLAEAVESVLTQTFRDLELTVIDDASTDSTPEILQAYASRDRRVRVVTNETNLQVARSLNLGLGLCRGEFVARMDADDVCLPERLDKQVELLRSHPEVSVCGTWVETIGDITAEVYRYPSHHDRIKCHLLFSCALAHPSVMFRRQVFAGANLQYDPKYVAAQDYDLWIRASRHCRFANIPEVLLRYRVHAAPLRQGNRHDEIAIVRPLRRALLEELGLTPSEAELGLHEALGRFDLECSAASLWASAAWLRRLLTANASHGFPYHPGELRREVIFRWSTTCVHAMPLAMKTPLVNAYWRVRRTWG